MTNFSKLAFMAQRSGQKGREALAVLQDALMDRYGAQFEAAIRKAKRRAKRTGRLTAVTFAPTMERAYGKHPHQREWYTAHHWPFVLSNPRGMRPTAVVVWDSDDGFNTHNWVESRRRR